jgi:hypothetical protein
LFSHYHLIEKSYSTRKRNEKQWPYLTVLQPAWPILYLLRAKTSFGGVIQPTVVKTPLIKIKNKIK